MKMYNSELKNQIHNFAFLIKEIKHDEECIENRYNKCDAELMSTASGLVISADKSSLAVLTSAHFCHNMSGFEPPSEMSAPTIIGIVEDLPRELNILEVDYDNDLCMLTGYKYSHEKFEKIKFPDKLPKIGEKVYAVAAPNSIGGPGIRLVFDGRFGGCTPHKVCIFTIPATYGSSGGGIYNKDGELLSIVMAITHDFENAVITPSHEAVKNFIFKIDESVDIY